MTTCVPYRTQHNQSERPLLVADVVDHFTSAGNEVGQVHPDAALGCAGGASTVVLVGDEHEPGRQTMSHQQQRR